MDIYKSVELIEEKVKDALEYLEVSDDETLKDQKDICRINAPSFHEGKRAEALKDKFEKLELSDVHIDEVGNVIAYIYGDKPRPKLLFSAHIDTVFKEDTDTEVKVEEGIFYAPGIGDNSRGVAEVLAVARAMRENDIKPHGTIMFCGNVCEEGLGDLKGIKHLYEKHKDIDGYMTPDNGHTGVIRFSGTGSHRYRVTFRGKGGHSFGDFGIPNAIHGMGRAIAKISDLKVPNHPRTTFSVGVIEGGISINTIAAEASMLVDIRSNAIKDLIKIENKIMKCIDKACEEENKRWKSNDLTVEVEMIGDRPAGSLEYTEAIVQTSIAAAKVMGIDHELVPAGSTDANVPISLGIPAIQVGFGGRAGGAHTLGEWYDPKGSHLGPQKHLLTVLGLLGLSGVTEPLLNIRNLEE